MVVVVYVSSCRGIDPSSSCFCGVPFRLALSPETRRRLKEGAVLRLVPCGGGKGFVVGRQGYYRGVPPSLLLSPFLVFPFSYRRFAGLYWGHTRSSS